MDIKQYFMFEGRSTRSEYWGTLIVSLLASLVIAFVYGMISGFWGFYDRTESVAVAIIVMLYSWVWVATSFRRCNDAGISQWFGLLIILPYIGVISAIVFGCLPTDKTDTKVDQ